MSRPDPSSQAPPDVAIPRDESGPVFPAPWAARAFALAVSLNERGLFAWSEWSELLGAEVGRQADPHAADPEVYWLAWIRALEAMLARKAVGSSAEIMALREAWRKAAEATPHGEPVELRGEAQS